MLRVEEKGRWKNQKRKREKKLDYYIFHTYTHIRAAHTHAREGVK